MLSSKEKLWREDVWAEGYFSNTVAENTDKNTIVKYVKHQGCTYNELPQNIQLSLFYDQ